MQVFVPSAISSVTPARDESTSKQSYAFWSMAKGASPVGEKGYVSGISAGNETWSPTQRASRPAASVVVAIRSKLLGVACSPKAPSIAPISMSVIVGHVPGGGVSGWLPLGPP
jgi:hypothetical protein